MGRFLDPIIVVRRRSGVFWTPNGHHRLAAMRALGARSILSVVVPEMAVAYQILAMNTEKGAQPGGEGAGGDPHGALPGGARSPAEKDFALEFEEPDYLTLGIAYEKRGRLSGGAYHPVLRRVEAYLDASLPQALEIRAGRKSSLRWTTSLPRR